MKKILLITIVFLFITHANAFNSHCQSENESYNAFLSAQIDYAHGNANIEIIGPNFERHSEGNDDVLSVYVKNENTLQFKISYVPEKSYVVIFKDHDYSKATLYRIVSKRKRFISELNCD